MRTNGYSPRHTVFINLGWSHAPQSATTKARKGLESLEGLEGLGEGLIGGERKLPFQTPLIFVIEAKPQCTFDQSAYMQISCRSR